MAQIHLAHDKLCEHNNEPFLQKVGKFLDQLSNYQLLMQEFVPLNYLVQKQWSFTVHKQKAFQFYKILATVYHIWDCLLHELSTVLH